MSSRLNAPEGYHWTADDVRYEKRDSWWDGLILGWLFGCGMGAVAVALAVIIL